MQFRIYDDAIASMFSVYARSGEFFIFIVQCGRSDICAEHRTSEYENGHGERRAVCVLLHRPRVFIVTLQFKRPAQQFTTIIMIMQSGRRRYIRSQTRYSHFYIFRRIVGRKLRRFTVVLTVRLRYLWQFSP